MQMVRMRARTPQPEYLEDPEETEPEMMVEPLETMEQWVLKNREMADRGAKFPWTGPGSPQQPDWTLIMAAVLAAALYLLLILPR